MASANISNNGVPTGFAATRHKGTTYKKRDGVEGKYSYHQEKYTISNYLTIPYVTLVLTFFNIKCFKLNTCNSRFA